MSHHQDPNLTIEIAKPKLPLWQRLGGTSLTIALVFHLILGVIAAYLVFQVIYPPEKKVDFLPPGGGGGERGAETKVNTKKRQQITPTTNVKRVFAEGASSNFAIPDQGDNFGEMSALSSLSSGGPSGGLGGSGSGGGFGAGTGKGSGLGMGAGTGKLFGLIPETMRKRCSKDDRQQRLKENGGIPECEEAVTKALRWLKANQKPDGSFADGQYKVSMTGLALLAYFGHCETPVSEEFGDSCMKGIVFLVNHAAKNNGQLATNRANKHWPYEHAIATYALGEAYTFCKELKVDIPQLPEMTEKAGQWIIDNQHDSGGWAYMYDKKGGHPDVSITAFHVQALKACSHSKINYRGMNSTITKALRYINDRQDKSGGFGYTSASVNPNIGYYTLTGAGVLSNQMWGKSSRSEVKNGIDYIRKNSKLDYNGPNADLYAHYYESQAMMQAGGDDWKHYNSLFRDQILRNQNPDGSWKVPGGGKSVKAVAPEFVDNAVYRTCLCTLMLEVYYRFLSTDSKGGSRGRSGGI